MKTVKFVILAGSYEEARRFMREHGLYAPNCIYPLSSEQLLGLENPAVIRVGNWRDMTHLEDIERELLLRSGR